MAEQQGSNEHQNGTKDKLLDIGCGVIFFGMIGVAALGVGKFTIDHWGDTGRDLAPEETAADAAARYNATYEAASPAGKFALQYLTTTSVAADNHVEDEGILGLFSFSGGIRDVYQFNNGCLNRTAYDITGGNIEATIQGLFTSGTVSGDIPTAAAYASVDAENPDHLVIASGHSNSIDLHFSGLQSSEGQLTPLDAQTTSQLETYGCSVGIQGSHEGTDYSTSPYVVTVSPAD